MKQQLFLAIAALSSSAFASVPGPNLIYYGHSKFSRSAMEKWTPLFKADPILQESYEQQYIKSNGCPKKLSDTKIEIARADGYYYNSRYPGDRHDSLYMDNIERSNRLRFVYNINDGMCGKIVVKTEQDPGTKIDSPYLWQQPEIIPFTSRHDMVTTIGMSKLRYGVLDAFMSAKKALPILSKGFSAVNLYTLQQPWFGKDFENQPIWHFQNVKETKFGVTDGPWDVLVSAKTGKAVVINSSGKAVDKSRIKA